jgi:hypothetical protein
VALGCSNGESLWRAIVDLACIVNPANNPHRCGAATHLSVVHIVGTQVTPTLMDLLLSALCMLSQANMVLHKDMQWIMLDCCNIVCVSKHGQNGAGGSPTETNSCCRR